MLQNRVKKYINKTYKKGSVLSKLRRVSEDTGISVKVLRNYFYEERNPSGKNLEILHDYFNIPISKITYNTLLYLDND